MKSKHIIYPSAILLMIIVPIARYYASTPWINSCVLEYVDNLEESSYKWYVYDINGVKHIEPLNSKNLESLSMYKVWKADGCLIKTNNLFSDLNNTFYCAITYMIRKSPVDDRLKEPLEILKTP